MLSKQVTLAHRTKSNSGLEPSIRQNKVANKFHHRHFPSRLAQMRPLGAREQN